MQYQYTAEQQEFRDSLRRFVSDHYDYERHRQRLAKGEHFDAGLWQQWAELGVLGLALDEEYGGLGSGLDDMMAVAEELGRGLVPEPVVPVVAAARLLASVASPAQAEALLPSLVAGELRLSLAWEESASRGNPLVVQTRVKDGALYGKKCAVLGAGEAQQWLVSARNEQGELLLLLIAAQPDGLRRYVMADGRAAGDIQFDGVPVDDSAVLCRGDAAERALRQSASESLLLMAAESLGCIDSLLSVSGEYLVTRKQFGMPLAAFQALQHRFADMFIAGEKLRSLLWAAFQQQGREGFHRAAAQLKVQLAESGRYVGQQAVQLHGGIGMTDELNVGAYFKRLTLMELLAGQRDDHLAGLALAS